MTKPLVFPPTPAPEPTQKASAPKPLAFPVTFKPQQSSQPPAPTPMPATSSKGPGVLFQRPLSAIARSTISDFKSKQPELYLAEQKMVDQVINDLMPINVTRVMEYGSSVLQGLSALSVECAEAVRIFSDLDGTKLINETLHVITTPPSFFGKLFSSSEVSTKPQLAVLKSNLNIHLGSVSALFERSEKVHRCVTLLVTILRQVTESSGESPDIALQDAIDERQKLFLQTTMQSQIVMQQLQDMRRQIVDQLSRVEQLVNVTIPTYETAKARR